MSEYRQLRSTKDLGDNDGFVVLPARSQQQPRSADQEQGNLIPDLAPIPESNDAVLREMRDAMTTLVESMGSMRTEMSELKADLNKVTTELKHVKYNSAKQFIMAVVQTKEFSRTIGQCIDETGQLDFEKFVQIIHNAEPRGLAAVIQRLMKENELTRDHLDKIMEEAFLTWEPEPEPEPEPVEATAPKCPKCTGEPANESNIKWSTRKKVMIGLAGAAGVAGLILVAVALFNPPALIALGVTAVGVGIAGAVGLGLAAAGGVGANFIK